MKLVHPGLRNIFYTGFALSLIAGIQLFLLSEKTDLYFAWTIQSALTASTIGAFYFGTMTFGWLSAQEKRWETVFAPSLGLFVFLWMTLGATLLHLDKFHFNTPSLLTRIVTWTWLLIYTLVPTALVIALLQQVRSPGSADANLPSESLPSGVRYLLLAHGLAGMLVGVFLFLAPQATLPFWGWTLTPLTARAFSAWLISYGVVDAVLVMKNNWEASRIPALGYLVSSVLGLAALLRYASEMQWLTLGGVGYLLYLLIMLGFGLRGVMKRCAAA